MTEVGSRSAQQLKALKARVSEEEQETRGAGAQPVGYLVQSQPPPPRSLSPAASQCELRWCGRVEGDGQ